jgi:hypothetical protein
MNKLYATYWGYGSLLISKRLKNIEVFGEYAMILYAGDSSKCIDIKMVIGIIHNYHMDK